jgi:hypothetical protein
MSEPIKMSEQIKMSEPIKTPVEIGNDPLAKIGDPISQEEFTPNANFISEEQKINSQKTINENTINKYFKTSKVIGNSRFGIPEEEFITPVKAKKPISEVEALSVPIVVEPSSNKKSKKKTLVPEGTILEGNIFQPNQIMAGGEFVPFTRGTEIISEKEQKDKSIRKLVNKMNVSELKDFYSKNIGEFNPINRKTGKTFKKKELSNIILDYMTMN